LFLLSLSHVDFGLILLFWPGETSFFALFLTLFARF
jgi:hypothetical protein